MRWGILGAGNIAHRFMESIAHHSDCRVLKVSARNEAKAIAFTKQYNIPMYTLIQEELFNDPAIDALYVALPHKFHKETIIKALKAGKAVLCEKTAVIKRSGCSRNHTSPKRNGALMHGGHENPFYTCL